MSAVQVQNFLQVIRACASLDVVGHYDYILTAVEHAVAMLSLCDEAADWVPDLINSLHSLSALLESIENHETASERKKIGRPRCNIPTQSIAELLELGFKVKDIGSLYGVSRMTVFRRMKAAALSVGKTYANISEENLQDEICDILLDHPYTGYKRMLGFLLAKGLRVTERRVRECMQIVDPLGVAERTARNRAIYRRVYFVRYAMERWHLDTNMKLTRRYKFIIRSCIDGNSRCCVYLKIGVDNTARSNLDSFMSGVRDWGLPRSVRCDKGGENWLVARLVLSIRGLDSGAVLTGRSVHNQRIERFWVDVYRDTKYYYDHFRLMEEKGILDIDNPNHLLLLHYIYVPPIQRGFNEFMRGWNHHKILTENYKTPVQ